MPSSCMWGSSFSADLEENSLRGKNLEPCRQSSVEKTRPSEFPIEAPSIEAPSIETPSIETPSIETPISNEEKRNLYSIVVVSSNDQYAGDSIGRITKMLTNVTAAFNGEAEVILIDWESKNGPIKNVLPASLVEKIRIVRVPRVIVETYPFFLEYVAKNVGVRRAKNKWILALNQDGLIPIALENYLKKASLNEKAFYRVKRQDEPPNVNPLPKSCYYPCDPSKNIELNEEHIKTCSGFSTWASGDFLLATRDAWEFSGGYFEDLVNEQVDSRQLYALYAVGYEQIYLSGGCIIMHQTHPAGKLGAIRTAKHYNSPVENPRACVTENREGSIERCFAWNNVGWGMLYKDLPEDGGIKG